MLDRGAIELGLSASELSGEVGIVAPLPATTPALVLPMLWGKTGDMPPPLAWPGAALVVAGSGMIFAG